MLPVSRRNGEPPGRPRRMLIDHFTRLSPVCPGCRRQGLEAALALSVIEAETGGDVEAGVLACEACGTEYPIVDGVPIIVPDLPRYTQDNLFYIVARDELPAAAGGVLGDAAGPGSALDAVRQHLSSYVWDHWGDQDPAEATAEARPGAIARAVEAGLALLDDGGLPEGPILDVGCGVGRSVVELARRTGRPVLGVDLSVPLARFARRALKERRVSYDRRRIGLAYDRRRFEIALEWPERAVDIWLCDLLALPFRAGCFALVTGFNVVDCLADPSAGIAALARVLKDDGSAILCTPFDWSGSVTPFSAWLGGGSRGDRAGAAEPVLARLLADAGFGAQPLHGIRTGEIPWQVRLHARARVCYRAHLTVACHRSATAVAIPSNPSV